MTRARSTSLIDFLKRFMLAPVLSEKTILLMVVFSLVFLSITQGVFLLLIKGFLAAFFTSADAENIRLGNLVPETMRQWIPAFEQLTISRSFLSVLVPVGIVVAGILKAFATYLYNLGIFRLSLKVAQNYREKIFEGVMALPWLSSSKRSPGEWMSVIMADAIFIQSRLTDFSTAFIKDGVLILSCLVTLSIIHWPAALALILIAPFIGWQMGRAGKRIAWFTEAFQRELGLLAGQLLGIRERFRFVRAQQGETFERTHFEARNTAYLKMMNGSIFLRAIVAPGMEWFGFFIFALFIYAWTRKIPGFDLSPDVVIQFFVALGLILRPIREMGEQVARWSETVGGLRRSMEVINEVDQFESQLGGVERRKVLSQHLPPTFVQINSMAISYERRLAFSASNLNLKPGHSVAIIGPSGAGKSTIVKCLAGLIPPSSWQASMPWPQIVNHTTLVSQSPFLFKDTLRGNLLYGLSGSERQTVTDKMLWDSLRLVNLEDTIKVLPNGLESEFNPIQTNLSGGQIQRLVIARAILRRPNILMLDEATAAIDGATERDISTRLIAASRHDGTILIAVTHRLRWLGLYDEVWFVENGRLELAGSHTDLLTRPRYRQFTSTEDGE